MTERWENRPKPRVRPRMNTDTKRHAEKPAYTRKNKYRDDPLGGVEPDDAVEDEGPVASEDEDAGTDEDDDRGSDSGDAPGERPGRKRNGRG